MADKITPDMTDEQVIAIIETLDVNNPDAARPVMAEASPRQIFVVAFQHMMNKQPDLAEKADGIDGSIKWVIEGDDGGSYLMAFGDGKVDIKESDDEATATVTLDMETWKGMLSGETNPQAAFMSGKMTIAGDMGLLMQLQGVMPAM